MEPDLAAILDQVQEPPQTVLFVPALVCRWAQEPPQIVSFVRAVMFRAQVAYLPA